jgi:addiction module HigA family antidote
LPPGDSSRASCDSLETAASLAIWRYCPVAAQFSIRINDQWQICLRWPEGSLGPVTWKSSKIIEGKIRMPRAAVHPGEHLAEELRGLGITAAELSRQIDVPVNRITGIIHGQRGITADTALRLGHWFGTAPQFWMNLQQLYELHLAESEVGAEIAALPRRAGRSTSRKLGKTA